MFTNRFANSSNGRASLLLKSEKVTYNNSNSFVLQGSPNTQAVILFIVNGVVYVDVSYDESTKTLTYNGEAKLEESDDIVVIYSESTSAKH